MSYKQAIRQRNHGSITFNNLYTLHSNIQSFKKHSIIGRIRLTRIHSFIQSFNCRPFLLFLQHLKTFNSENSFGVYFIQSVISFIAFHSRASSPPDFVAILEHTKYYLKFTSRPTESASGSSRLATKGKGLVQPKTYIHAQVTFNH